MKIYELDNVIGNQIGYNMDYKEITVHTGGNNWEEIVDVVFCQECDQYHIISERIADGV